MQIAALFARLRPGYRAISLAKTADGGEVKPSHILLRHERGSDASGLEHPNWRSNLALALYLQEAVGRKHPTLMRPVTLVQQRYNQHLTTGSLILEVGSSGNTLQEALAAIRLFADAAAPALLALTESDAPPADP